MSPAWLPPLLLAIPGALAARRLLPGGGAAEAAGLGLLLSLSVGLNLLFVAHLLGLPLTAGTALGLLALLAVAALAALRRAGPAPARGASPPPPAAGRTGGLDAAPWTPAELLLAGLVVLTVVLSSVKGTFYPIIAADAHAYDGRARWLVAEKTLHLGIYRELGATGATNLSYPPLFPLSLALGYWVGAAQGRVIDTYYFAAAALLLYGLLRRRLPRLGALAGALLLVTTPEIWNHASLALLNLPSMAFLGGALLVALWLLDPARPPADDRAGWLLAGLLAAGAAGVRSDAALLALGALPLLAWRLARRQPAARGTLLRLALFVGPALVVTALWQFYLKTRLGLLNSEPFRPGLVSDGATLWLIMRNFLGYLTLGSLFGLTAWLALAAFVITLAWRPRPVRPALDHALAALLLALSLIALYQALDPAFGGGLKELLPTSFKRGIFYLIPLLIAATLLAPPVRRALERVDAWQRSA